MKLKKHMDYIHTKKDIEQAIKQLIKLCPTISKVYEEVGEPPLRKRQGGFPGLARIIVGQQLSIASANAIWTRVDKLVSPMSAKTLQSFTDETLKTAGLSRPKIKTLRALSEAIEQKQVNLKKLEKMSEEEIKETLTQISGIGPWTADIYIMFCLGKTDGWAPGDLALQYAVQDAFALKDRPKPKEMIEIANKWRPWRAVAARLLWAYYKHQRQKSSGVPV